METVGLSRVMTGADTIYTETESNDVKKSFNSSFTKCFQAHVVMTEVRLRVPEVKATLHSSSLESKPGDKQS